MRAFNLGQVGLLVQKVLHSVLLLLDAWKTGMVGKLLRQVSYPSIVPEHVGLLTVSSIRFVDLYITLLSMTLFGHYLFAC
jgi:hypothetical protein